jgi:hypothetical protein
MASEVHNSPYVDRQQQFDLIKPLLFDEERVHAVLDCKGGGTGFVALTDQRIIFMDQSWIKKHKVIQAIPYSQINAVGLEEEGMVLKSSIIWVISGPHSFQFQLRGHDKALGAHKFISKRLS